MNELERIVFLQDQFVEAEKMVAERLAARNRAIKELVDSGVTKYRIAKTLGVTATTVANAVASAEKNCGVCGYGHMHDYGKLDPADLGEISGPYDSMEALGAALG